MKTFFRQSLNSLKEAQGIFEVSVIENPKTNKLFFVAGTYAAALKNNFIPEIPEGYSPDDEFRGFVSKELKAQLKTAKADDVCFGMFSMDDNPATAVPVLFCKGKSQDNVKRTF